MEKGVIFGVMAFADGKRYWYPGGQTDKPCSEAARHAYTVARHMAKAVHAEAKSLCLINTLVHPSGEAMPADGSGQVEYVRGF